jgi:alpha-mannosidase
MLVCTPLVLPGSAIGMVYEDAEKLYAEVHDKGLKLLDEAFDALLEKSQRMAAAPLLKSASAMRVIGFNTVHYPRYEVVQLSTAGPQGARLKSEVVQLSKDGLTGYALMDASRGTNLAYPRGMFADMKTSSGTEN